MLVDGAVVRQHDMGEEGFLKTFDSAGHRLELRFDAEKERAPPLLAKPLGPYVKGRKMALARIIAPQGLMNTELKSRAVKEVARVLKAALGVGREEDDTGIWTMCIEIDDGQWAVGATIPTLAQFLDNLGANVSEQRRAEMSARYPQKR